MYIGLRTSLQKVQVSITVYVGKAIVSACINLAAFISFCKTVTISNEARVSLWLSQPGFLCIKIYHVAIVITWQHKIQGGFIHSIIFIHPPWQKESFVAC